MGQIASILGQITTSAISVGLIDNCFKLVQRVLGIKSRVHLQIAYVGSNGRLLGQIITSYFGLCRLDWLYFVG